jgi:hypothetical protein
VIHALSAAGGFTSRLHGGQQQRDQGGNDRNDHKQFDERKTRSPSKSLHGMFLTRQSSSSAPVLEPTGIGIRRLNGANLLCFANKLARRWPDQSITKGTH